MQARRLVLLAWLPLALGLSACGMQGGSQVPLTGSGDGGASATARPASELHGLWYLESLEKAGEAKVSVPRSRSFTADFGSDGRVHLVADCNVCNAAYSATGSALSVSPMPCTRAYCSSAPLDTDFAGLLGSAVSWSVDGKRLTLASPRGTLRMIR
jgi:heat shock protein HslJ